jgi:HEXXH motif-containing protein
LELEARGFRFAPTGAAPLALLDGAEGWIRLAPDLEAIAARVVRSLHVLIAEPGFDISHSEPRWRSTIFLSIPERADSVGALRFAESAIHEAMHLHLTNAEAIAPLVMDFASQMASPWRAEPRSHQGVAHALFVFTCLAVLFRRIVEAEVGDYAVRQHLQTRLDEIRGEVMCLDLERLVGGLTERGVSLANRWRSLAVHAAAGRSLETATGSR